MTTKKYNQDSEMLKNNSITDIEEKETHCEVVMHCYASIPRKWRSRPNKKIKITDKTTNFFGTNINKK